MTQMKIEKYQEELSAFIAIIHDACEGRHELTGYELHVIEAALNQLAEIKTPRISDEECVKIGLRGTSTEASRIAMYHVERGARMARDWYDKELKSSHE